MALDSNAGPVCPGPQEKLGKDASPEAIVQAQLETSQCLSAEVERIQKSLDELKLKPATQTAPISNLDYSLPTDFKFRPDLSEPKADPFNLNLTNLNQKPLTDKDIDRIIKESRMPLGGALPVETFRLEDFQNKRLNLDLPKDYLSGPSQRYGPMTNIPMLPPNEEIRRWLDRKVTTDFQMGNNTITFSLNGRRCGLRSRPALCFSTPIK